MCFHAILVTPFDPAAGGKEIKRFLNCHKSFLLENEVVVFFNLFFLLNFFLQQHENIIKSNNKKNNYINQLLRLPLLKYTHTEKKILHI